MERRSAVCGSEEPRRGDEAHDDRQDDDRGEEGSSNPVAGCLARPTEVPMCAIWMSPFVCDLVIEVMPTRYGPVLDGTSCDRLSVGRADP